MGYSYTLKNLRTGEEKHGLKAGEVRQLIGIPSGSVSHYAVNGRVYQDTWKMSIDMDEDDYSEFWTDEMCMKWDCVRKMVLGGFRRIKNKNAKRRD